MAPPSQLTIKTNAVSRLLKEVSAYEKDCETSVEQLESMKAQGKDEYEIKNQSRIVDETRKMVPDTKQRLESVTDELKSLLTGYSQEDQDAEVVKARETVALAEA